MRLLEEKGLLSARQVGVDSTTLEANAAMKSIVRRDTGENYQEYLNRLMAEEGAVEEGREPTPQERQHFDRQRPDKKVSNREWESPTDPDSRIARMKDGRTHLAYKAEHVVDLETEAILSAEVLAADTADTASFADSVVQAQMHLNESGIENPIEEVAADRGYHSVENLELAEGLGLRTYIPERTQRGRRRWRNRSAEAQRAFFNNRRRMERAKGKRLSRLRSGRVERSFAHVCDTGGMRRQHVRGLINVRKRYLLAAAGYNLGLALRQLLGVGKPRGWQGLTRQLLQALLLRLLTYITSRRIFFRFWHAFFCSPLLFAPH